MAEGNPIGEYLRARRELLRPEDVGLPEADRRRVPGLRRSELAMLAGISNEYYVRLEQGRDRHPSAPVLAALARALQLDEHASAHLYKLATPAPRRAPRPKAERVSAQIDVLLRALERTTPAYVTGRFMNVLSANDLATAVVPLLVPGTNFVRAVFLDPMAEELDAEIVEGRQAAAVAGLRAFAGPDVEDPELVELVGELSVKSPEFRRLWSRHDVKPVHGALPRMAFRHPQLGPIELYHQKLDIPDTGGQTLGLLYAEPGSKTEQAVAMLAATMGTPNAAPPQDHPARRTQTPAELA